MLNYFLCANIRQFLSSFNDKSKVNHIQNSAKGCTKVKTETEAVVWQN